MFAPTVMGMTFQQGLVFNSVVMLANTGFYGAVGGYSDPVTGAETTFSAIVMLNCYLAGLYSAYEMDR